ncbi:twin-arginine translocase TatA/TatE family subunit [Pedobacter ginsengisoli]|uniref:Sec-independent protein translocase protein TatA n=1 Tax=Pedobacter ginsengisoli TaxID=363852 RepID=A0A2D1U8I8_9SPHI|nr:twin-arginine translocase TatA/TatE family subunit [Pedobacter ginsengisoli]ATP57911.1 twin-arginine translocase TatA/TatE family subunit [Pedobacter ginsengisoli]
MYRGTLIEFLNMGGGEIMLILAVVLLLFGGKKLPELARGLGKGIRDFKDASEGVKREIHRNINSVGIVDDIESVINDTNVNRHHPSESTPEQHAQDAEETKEPVDFEKQDLVAANDNTENTKIETDKTKL